MTQLSGSVKNLTSQSEDYLFGEDRILLFDSSRVGVVTQHCFTNKIIMIVDKSQPRLLLSKL